MDLLRLRFEVGACEVSERPRLYLSNTSEKRDHTLAVVVTIVHFLPAGQTKHELQQIGRS